MKNLAVGILTAICATTIAFAQAEQSTEWVDAQSTSQPAYQPAVAEQTANVQPTNTLQPVIAQSQTTAAYANNQINSTSETSVNNDNTAMPIDEQPTMAPKKNPIGIGARAAFIYGNFWGFKDLKSDGMEPPTGIGGEFGIAARFTLAKGLQFSPEIAFRIFDVSHDEDDIKREYNQMFLDFAFYIRGILGGGFFLEVAPQISINTNSEYTYDGEKNTFENIEQASAEFGLNFGAGYYILDNLSIGFRWYMGFTEIFPDVKLYNHTTREDITQDDIDPKTGKPKSGIKYSTINLKGAHTMMFKFGVTYWFI